MKRFNGNVTKWIAFWDSFNSAVHNNPSLSNVDKFTYLHSLLDASAAEAIAGLTLSSANYEEAVTTLKQRFGNPQLIIDKHMNSLLNLPSVTSHYDLKGLRRLYDSTESNVRGLRALGISAESFGSLLTSILMDKLPSEIRIIISRELTEEKWSMEDVMRIVSREVTARERSAASSSNPLHHPKKHSQWSLPRRDSLTAATLMTSNQGPPTCVYCDQEHRSTTCTVVKSVKARRDLLRKAGRCYLSLRKQHMSRDCRSTTLCGKCHGRHHVSLCPRNSSSLGTNSSQTTHDLTQVSQSSSNVPASGSQNTTNMCVNSQTPVLLQTAKVYLHNPQSDNKSHVTVMLVMDSGSQRTFLTNRARQTLNLNTLGSERLSINTFGTTTEADSDCDIVEFKLETNDGVR